MGIDRLGGRGIQRRSPKRQLEMLLVGDHKSWDKGSGGVCKVNPLFPTLSSRFFGGSIA